MSEVEGAGPEAGVKKEAVEAGGAEVGGSGGVPPKVDTGKRFAAIFIDGILASIIAQVGWQVGGILGGGVLGGLLGAAGSGAAAGYMALRDSLNDGRSFGKKALGLTVQTPDGTPCTQEQSIKRNSLLALPYAVSALLGLLGAIPIIGPILVLVGVLPSLLFSLPQFYESLQVLALDPNGRRLMETKSETYTVLA